MMFRVGKTHDSVCDQIKIGERIMSPAPTSETQQVHSTAVDRAATAVQDSVHHS